MIEFLIDPAAVAVIGSVAFGLILKRGEAILRHRKPAPEKPMTFREVADSTPVSVYNCAVYSDRLFEQRFIDAGIDTELSVCENKECDNCYPDRRKEAPEIGTVNSKAKRTHPDDTKRRREPVPYKKRKEIEANKFMAKAEYEMSKSGQGRRSVVDGYWMPIPPNVPKRATGTLIYDPLKLSDFVLWAWEEEGKRMAYRRDVSDGYLQVLEKADKHASCDECDDLGTVSLPSLLCDEDGEKKTVSCESVITANEIRADRIGSETIWK